MNEEMKTMNEEMKTMNEEMITITKNEYDNLSADSEFLNALEAAGVDNWDGYSLACEMMESGEIDS